jgi:hypothetical protein
MEGLGAGGDTGRCFSIGEVDMPLYQQSVFKPAPIKMQTGVLPIYLFGNLDPHQTPFKFSITNVSQTTTTVTATVVLKSGGGPPYLTLPVVGQIIGVQGVTAGSGNMNTSYAAITAVSLDVNGSGTISYTVATSQTVASVASPGELVALPYETSDAITTTSASWPVTQSFTPDDSDNSRCLFVDFKFPTIPTSCTITLQGANVDDDTRYQTLQNSYGTLVGSSTIIAESANAAVVAAGAVTQSGAMYQFIMCKFLRFKVTAISGTMSTIGTVFA